MITVDDHARHIERMLRPALSARVAETVPLGSALGRVTFADVRSAVDLPLFRNSQMDGFAVRSADLAAGPTTLAVVADAPAGRPVAAPLQPGTAVRIMTGAPVPDGADAVAPVEDTDQDFGRPGDQVGAAHAGATVTVRRPRVAGEFVREAGSDLRRGDVLVASDVRLAPRHLAALAAAGLREVAVRRRVRVAVITTGAELVGAADSAADPAADPAAGPATNCPVALASGQIFDANNVALTAAVTEAGADVSFTAQTDDQADTFRRALGDAVAASDLVITSGGISQGAFEVVRDVLEPLGASVEKVAMQPGGPQATAVVNGVPVLCFPGNPVSTQVSFVVFLRNPLRAAAGLPPIAAQTRALAQPVESVAGKRQFLRGRRLPDGTVEQASGASSHLVAAMARSDLLIDIPAETTSLPAGSDVRVWAL